jgi:hypothetical protein
MVFSSLGILLMALSGGPLSLILSFSLVTLANPIMNNLYFTRLILGASDAERGRLTGLSSTLTDLNTLLLLSTFVNSNEYMSMPVGFLWLVPLVMLRAVFVKKALVA